MKIIVFLEKHQSLITALCTVVLAMITWRYMLETKKMRKIAADSFQAETAPIVFLEFPAPIRKLDLQTRQFMIIPKGIVKNAGKSTATNLDIEYCLRKGSTRLSKKLLTAPYIYPTQQFILSPEAIAATLSDAVFADMKKIYDEKSEPVLRKDFAEQWFFDATLKYVDPKKNEQIRLYTFVYHWDQNSWGIVKPGTEKVEL